MLADFLTRDNHDQIPHVANLVLVMGHELSRESPPLPVFWDHFVPIHRDINGLLHLVRHHLPHQCTPRVAAGRVVDEVPSGDGGHVSEFIVAHLFELRSADWSAIIVGFGFGVKAGERSPRIDLNWQLPTIHKLGSMSELRGGGVGEVRHHYGGRSRQHSPLCELQHIKLPTDERY